MSGSRRHAAPRSRSRSRLLLTLAALIVVAAATVVAVVASTRDEAVRPAPGEPSDAAPPASSDSVLVLPVIPVGGDTADGEQTLDSARAGVDEAAEYGAGGIRITADMRFLCESEDCDLEPLEPVVERARELGLRVYLHVNSTPEWVHERGRWTAPEGEDAEVWADLFAQLVDRFGTEVAGYEVWNEPNLEQFWTEGPDPDAYADLLKAVWTAAKDVNPDVTIIGGILSNNDLGYMSALSAALAERGGNEENSFFYDQLGVHPYAGGQDVGFDPELPAGSVEQQTEFGTKDMTFLGVERLRAQVAEDEGIWRDVVIGEFGYDTTPGSFYHVEEPLRAEYLATALRLADEWDWLLAFTPYSYTAGSDDGFSIRGTESEEALELATAELGG